MLSKSLIQFSVDGQGYVPSLLFGLRSNYGRGNGDLLQKDLCQHGVTPRTGVVRVPDSTGRPLLTHTCTGDSSTVTGKSSSVSCGVTTSFS